MREKDDAPRWHYLKQEGPILIGGHCHCFNGCVPVLGFVSSAEDYGESETGNYSEETERVIFVDSLLHLTIRMQ